VNLAFVLMTVSFVFTTHRAHAGPICITKLVESWGFCSRTWNDNHCPVGQKEYHAESCVLKKDLDLVALNLTDGEVVPEQVYENSPSKAIALSLIARLYKQELKDDLNKKNVLRIDLFEKTEIIMAVRQKYVGSILEFGFKNYHQIQHTEGAAEPRDRAVLEDLMLGLRLEKDYGTSRYKDLVNQIRPKYAFLQPSSEVESVLPDNSITDQYGEIFFVFKSSVKRRSTFTSDDSLCFHCLKNLTKIGNKTFFSTVNPLDLRREREGHSVFLDAQIFGELSSSDVDYALVSCGDAAGEHFEPVQKKVVQQLKRAGIDVYQCVPRLNSQGKSLISRLDRGEKL